MAPWRKDRLAKLTLVAIIDDDSRARHDTDKGKTPCEVTRLRRIYLRTAEEFLRSNRLDDLSCGIQCLKCPE